MMGSRVTLEPIGRSQAGSAALCRDGLEYNKCNHRHDSERHAGFLHLGHTFISDRSMVIAQVLTGGQTSGKLHGKLSDQNEPCEDRDRTVKAGIARTAQ